jgi:SOS response regulatory protein OraA/RecX
MKLSIFQTVSLAGNLLLATAYLALRQGSPTGPISPLAQAPMPANQPAQPPKPAAIETVAPMAPWRLIESVDYRQYIANLRLAGCPEWLIRDIIVADIDDLYQQKNQSDPAYVEPWLNADQRAEVSHSQSAKRQELRRQKRALVKTLLGYEWDNHAEEIWNWDLPTSLTLGFLPDEKAAQVLARRGQADDDAQSIRGAANFILLDADRARLQSLYDGLQADLELLLDPSEFDELQLRAQQSFLVANDLHFDGVSLAGAELRNLVRASRSFKDIARNEFVPDRPVSEARQNAEAAGFTAQVKNLLGAEQFADYQRAQDSNFREIFAFSQQNNLPKKTAIAVYDSRQIASQQAGEIQNDGNLSADERATALQVLKAATRSRIAAALGGNFQDYLAGPGQWIETLAPPPAPMQAP